MHNSYDCVSAMRIDGQLIPFSTAHFDLRVTSGMSRTFTAGMTMTAIALTLIWFPVLFSSALFGADIESRYESVELCGWRVHIRTELMTEDRVATTKKGLGLLEAQLQKISSTLPQSNVDKLKHIQLFISPVYSGFEPRAEYHPNREWLMKHGRDPDMAKSVEFTNIEIFEEETFRMPCFVLHELAHAFHDQFVMDGFQNKSIAMAYENAKSSGIYQRVQRRNGLGRVDTQEVAYALTNPQEYFAESTESYFGENDFEPFNRKSMQETDRRTYDLMHSIWELNQQSSPSKPQ